MSDFEPNEIENIDEPVEIPANEIDSSSDADLNTVATEENDLVSEVAEEIQMNDDSDSSESPNIQNEPPKKSIAQLESERQELERKRNLLDEQIARWEQSAQQLVAWKERHSRSFLWKVLQEMKSNLDTAVNKLAKYNEIVENISIPEPGTMITLRKKFHKRLLGLNLGIPAICALLLWLPTVTGINFISNALSPYFVYVANPLRMVLMYAIGVYLFLFFAALVAYYRGWASFERKVRTSLWELDSVSSGVAHVRGEEMRLKSLYPQVREWLEIIGHSLSNPWRIRDEWFSSDIGSINPDSIPYSLRVAQPIDEDTSSSLAMQREAAERFMLKGWRAKVFADQVDAVREKYGLASERLNVDQLDRDISYSPNGPRSLLYASIHEPEVLENVGKKQLLPLISEVQRNAITKSRPPVAEVRANQFKQLKKSTEDLFQEKKVEWDSFLSVSLPTPDKVRTTLSVLGLSDAGRLKNYQDSYETFVIAPARFANHLESVNGSNKRLYAESSQLPMDIVVRTDFTGPIAREHLLFLAKTKDDVDRERSKAEEIIKRNLEEGASGIN
jgi:hypothetical protein